MNRSLALILSLAAAVAAVAGVLAVTSTLALGGQARATTDQQVAQRTAQLDRYEASLTKALAQKPPALPPVPHASSTASAGTAATAPARIVYRRAPAVVVGQAGDDDEHEHEHEEEHGQEKGHGHDDEGVELDD